MTTRDMIEVLPGALVPRRQGAARSSFQPRMIQVTPARAVQVAWAGDTPGLLVNRDASTTVILGADDGMQATGNAIGILDPQTALATDGSTDIWATTISGTAIVNRLPSGTGLEQTAAPASPAPAVPWLPSDVGLLTANYDLPAAWSAQGLTAGWLYLAQLHVRAALTLSTLWFAIGGSASGTGRVDVGAYSQDGTTQLSSCGNVITQFSLSIYAQCTLLASLALTSWIWIMLVSNTSASQAQPRCTNLPAAHNNLALPQASWQFGVITGAHATLPASFSPSAMISSVAVPYWVGAS